MEIVKERRGRVAAGKHRTRPVTVHMRTVTILSDAQRERVRECAGCAVLVGCVVLTGIVEGSPWPM